MKNEKNKKIKVKKNISKLSVYFLALSCVLVSCHVRVSEWIYTL